MKIATVNAELFYESVQTKIIIKKKTFLKITMLELKVSKCQDIVIQNRMGRMKMILQLFNFTNLPLGE